MDADYFCRNSFDPDSEKAQVSSHVVDECIK